MFLVLLYWWIEREKYECLLYSRSLSRWPAGFNLHVFMLNSVYKSTFASSWYPWVWFTSILIIQSWCNGSCIQAQYSFYVYVLPYLLNWSCANVSIPRWKGQDIFAQPRIISFPCPPDFIPMFDDYFPRSFKLDCLSQTLDIIGSHAEKHRVHF